MTAKNKDIKIITRLEKVPFTFNKNIKNLMQRHAKILLMKLRREYECQEYDHHEEIKRYYNLTTYLYYFLGNVMEAKQCNREALEMDPESIVALGNRACMHHRENKRNEDLKEVENIIARVEALCLNREKLPVAKAEIAYSYARFGMMYYKQAESIYREVLKEVTDGDILPTVLWQYGCGLLNRRILAQTYYGFKENVQEHDDRIMRAADLLFKVAKNGTYYRLVARAWAELGNLSFAQKRNQKWISLIPEDLKVVTADMMFDYAVLTNKHISDIPVLEQCANHFKRLGKYDECERLLRNSLRGKKSSRAYIWIAEVLKKQFMNNLDKIKERKPEWIPDCDKTREILKMLDAAIDTELNFTAMECKGKFLMEMGKIMEAVDVFEDIYTMVNTTEIQPEECDHNVKVFCHIYLAKCLLYLAKDEDTITCAKDLLRIAIEMTVCVRRKREQSQNLTDNQSPTTSSMTKSEFDVYGLPRLSKLLKDAVEEMRKLLQKGKKTKESVFDEIALCALLGEKDQVSELCREFEGMNIDTDDQLKFAQVLIHNREFGKGLFYLNHLIICGKCPQEMNEFAIEAHVDGAIDAMKRNDMDIAGARLRAAFDLKFAKEDITPKRENWDIFLIANESNRDSTRKLQELFGHLTKLEITSCFDTMQAGLIFKSLENSIEQCSIVVILLGEGDLTNRDPHSELFQMVVESACITCKEQKALIVITLSKLRVIPSCLANVPCLELIKPLQNGKEWMHKFFRQTLIK